MHESHIDELRSLYHSFGRQSAAEGFSAVPRYLSPRYTAVDIQGNSTPVRMTAVGANIYGVKRHHLSIHNCLTWVITAAGQRFVLVFTKIKVLDELTVAER